MAATVNAQQGTAKSSRAHRRFPAGCHAWRDRDSPQPGNGTFRTTVSGVDGSFFIGAMNPGVYQVEAMLDGFRPYQQNDVRLKVVRYRLT